MGQSVRRLLKLRWWLRVCAAAGLFAVAAAAWAAQATLIADAHVNSATPSMNSGAISNLNVGAGYVALVQFDSSMLPPGTTAAQVSRAVLRLYVNRVNGAGPVSLAPVTSSWSEYGVTYANEPSAGSAIGQLMVSQAGTFVAIDVTSQVQAWIANPGANYGLELSAATADVQFDSKENDQTAHPASLDIELVDAGPAGAPGATGPTGLKGSTGTNGATGSQGPIGSTGPQGPTGVAGSGGGLTYQGTYSSTQNYAVGDVVVWQGASYTSLIATNHGNTPSLSPQWWGVVAAQGLQGATGPAGPTGGFGPQGLPGGVGPSGPVGAQGSQGIAGQAAAQGIPGTTGATGLSGPMGPQGFPGPVGITFQGTYSSTTNYAIADGVSYKGSGYVSLIASNIGNTPDQSPLQWALFAAAGSAGATGPIGSIGITGATGPAGPDGIAGPTGAAGAIGPQGPPVANYLGNYQSPVNYALHDAVSWQGSTYVSLLSSNYGNAPDQSPTQWALLAAQGPRGAAGVDGSVGAAGPGGPSGAQGSAGPQGPPASFRGGWLVDSPYALGDAVAYGGSSYIALSANTGREPDISPVYWALLAAAGAAGPAGASGATGMQGPTGYAGAAGETGAQGAAGPGGSAGAPGPTGATGPAGLTGATGPAGATGAIGLPGINGANGIDGADGHPGMVFRGTWLAGSGYVANDAVTYGNPASTYLATSASVAQDPIDYPVVWMVLAQAGSVGPSGPTGSAATITIGTVTTAPSGTPASVINSGTTTDAVLNLTIPQGATGPSGNGGGGGGGTSGIPYASVYHVEPPGTPGISVGYYSVNNPNSGASETAAVLTWVPNVCTVTGLSVYSQLTAGTTLTLRSLVTPVGSASTLFTCTVAAGPSATTCYVPNGTQISAGSFVDFGIVNQSGPSSPALWTALACN